MSSWLPLVLFLFDAVFIVQLYVLLYRLISRVVCGIRLCWFLIIAFAFTFYFILGSILFTKKVYILKRHVWLRPNIPIFVELPKKVIENVATFVYESLKLRTIYVLVETLYFHLSQKTDVGHLYIFRILCMKFMLCIHVHGFMKRLVIFAVVAAIIAA